MATYKRRVVYLSDEEWSKVNQRAEAFNLSSSAYIRKLIEWRQPGPIYIETSRRGKDGETPPPPDTVVLSKGTIDALSSIRTPEEMARPFTEFRPAPKPGRKS